jgi:D-alanyl-D-alanine carboxypeptidase, serine-type, PBP4 family
MKIRILISILLLASLSGYSKNIKPNNVQKFINNQLKKDTLFQNAIVGIMAIDSKGNTIAEWNSNLPLLTASTMKTITTGCGLYYLGTDYKFSTKIAYAGEIKNGILNGDIYIEGGGDPTLGSKDTVAFAIDSIFGIWRDAIKKCGINKINGNIIVDDSYFQREPIPDSWEWGNLGPSYGSSPSGLAFCENMQYFKLTPGKHIGDKASISIIYPMLPGLNVINEVYTAEPKSGDQSWYYVQDMSMKSKYTGTIPIDRDSIISDNSNLYPYLSCGFEFKHFLLNNEIEVYGGVIDIMETETNPQRHYIAETYSPELWKIVNVTNRISNNFYAETILKAIGKKIQA